MLEYFYIARLEHLKLKTLEEIKIANDVMFLFKNLDKKVDVDFNKHFSFNSDSCKSRGQS